MKIATFNHTFDYHERRGNISDIARSLGAQPRYLGHTPIPYSIAQHAVACCVLAQERQLSERDQFTALMHDAAEAYCGDLPNPVKKHLSDYTDLIEKVEHSLAEQFDFDMPEPELVKQVDFDLYQFERRGISKSRHFPHHASPEPPPPRTQDVLSRVWPYPEARSAFVLLYDQYRPQADLDFHLTVPKCDGIF